MPGDIMSESVGGFAGIFMQGDGDRAGELLGMLNPIHRTDTQAGVNRYKAEPYVIAADIYSQTPHVGRGGWTWYTGSAAWMYRVTLEGLLGFRVNGAHLYIDPCIPRSWIGFEISYHYRSSRYEISVDNPTNVCRGIAMIKLDDALLKPDAPILLVDDGALHHISLTLGAL
jgi:cyclic beta-1,2-glucan synthetase